jgi:hypothetical protein
METLATVAIEVSLKKTLRDDTSQICAELKIESHFIENFGVSGKDVLVLSNDPFLEAIHSLW